MNTKKIQRLKILVTVLIAANTLMCFGMEVMAISTALSRDKIATALYFAAAIINVVAVEMLIVLHDAIIAELEERKARKQKARKRPVSGREVFPTNTIIGG